MYRKKIKVEKLILILVIIGLCSCKQTYKDEGDYHTILSQTELDEMFSVKYCIVEVKNDIVYAVLDSILKLSPLQKNIAIELSFDTNGLDTCSFNINVIQRIKTAHSHFDDFFIQKGNAYFTYKTFPILVHYADNQMATDYFVLTEQEEYFSFVADYEEPAYFMENVYKNKNEITKRRVFKNAYCSFQIRTINNKIVSILADYDTSNFKTMNELINIYGNEIDK
ncbi:MAG: hypothetical protein LBO06_08535 [Bacteroidales bacterium]|jgi:hypothetical protein|nr:hypothetical protein [Bacteroidales bacterium]